MSSRGSIALGNNQGFNGSSFLGSSAGFASQWYGGRTALVINATAYGVSPGLQLQMLGPSGSWMNVASSFVADQSFIFDAAPGQYRMVSQSSISTAVFAVMVAVPYNL